MFMFVGFEGACNHDIAEVAVGSPDLDEALMAESQAKVTHLPGNGFSGSDEAFGHTVDGLLARCLHLQIDTEGELKAPFHWCFNFGHGANRNHVALFQSIMLV